MARFELRPAVLDDAEAATEVWLGSRHAAIVHIPQSVHSDAEVREWISAHILAHDECWVARADSGEIVGLLILHEGWIEQLYISPDRQRQGAGSALVDLAKRQTPGRLQLWTFASNAPAQRFYERHGFVCVETTDGADNEEHAPDMRYVFDPHSD